MFLMDQLLEYCLDDPLNTRILYKLHLTRSMHNCTHVLYSVSLIFIAKCKQEYLDGLTRLSYHILNLLIMFACILLLLTSYHWSNLEVKLSDGLKGLRPQAWSPSYSKCQYHQHVCMFCTKTEVEQVKLMRFSFMGLTLIRARFKGISADYGFSFKQSHAEVWAN